MKDGAPFKKIWKFDVKVIDYGLTRTGRYAK
jgi:hypothetical protein